MIFVSFGNVPLGFNRMAKAIDEYAKTIDEKIIVQFGNCNYPFKNCEAHQFIDHTQMLNYLKKASLVILQGGWGAMFEASELGCRIIAVPRIMGEEHHHDQFQLVKELEKSNVVIGVYEMSSLAAKIEEARKFNFQSIKRGSAIEIITEKITEWFSTPD